MVKISTCENWDIGVVDCPYIAYTRPKFVYQASITGLKNTLHRSSAIAPQCRTRSQSPLFSP
ncbi:hypothetical protein [Nostoc sp. CALU 546]|uniref:hypothetical protein n=1 Tax=Nostoc sp. CALU 546 TaxID=1867241 RepID=UPI003B67C282